MCSAVCVRLFFISLFIIDLELDGTLLMVVIREDMVDNQNQKKDGCILCYFCFYVYDLLF